MALTSDEVRRLFAGLEARGWSWREEVIYAPAESIWLERYHPWEGSLLDMCERMTARLERIQRNRDMYASPDDYAGVEKDTHILVGVLQELVRTPK
ncbi:MAG: hypothetical protein U0271_17540 [Polyangiaceae bacterium]